MRLFRGQAFKRTSQLAFTMVLGIFLSCFVLGLSSNLAALANYTDFPSSCCAESSTCTSESAATSPELCMLQTQVFKETDENCSHLGSQRSEPIDYLDASMDLHEISDDIHAQHPHPAQLNTPVAEPPLFVLRYAINAPPTT